MLAFTNEIGTPYNVREIVCPATPHFPCTLNIFRYLFGIVFTSEASKLPTHFMVALELVYTHVSKAHSL